MKNIKIFLLGLSLISFIALPLLGSERVPVILAAEDTLGLIQRPIVNIPFMGLARDSILMELELPAGEEILKVELIKGSTVYPLQKEIITNSNEHDMHEYAAYSKIEIPAGLYDMAVTLSDAAYNDTVKNSVCILPAYRDHYYFIQVTDTHMPSHLFWGNDGVEMDLTELEDFRAVIDDINIIKPEFVLHTGDFINDGELEALGVPAISISKQLLYELEVPLFMVAGNHDLGGWDATPAPDGTARRTWWKYFGWKYLNPEGNDGIRTQNYSFDYGDSCHFIGLESYVNYDGWNYDTYGYQGFLPEQIRWMNQDLFKHVHDMNVLFYHKDFEDDLNLTTLGVDAAFYGHIHKNKGNEDVYPLNLATDNICDGARAYRIVEVQNGEIIHTQVLYAGSTGDLISRQTSIDGRTVTLINKSDMAFMHCRVDIPLFCSPSAFQVENARIYSIDTLAETVTVEADLPANGFVRIQALEVQDTTSVNSVLPVDFKFNIYPNPFNPSLNFSYELPSAMRTNVSVVNMKGEQVAILHSGNEEAGSHHYTWNGELYPSGIYLLRFYGESSQCSYSVVKKGLLIR